MATGVANGGRCIDPGDPPLTNTTELVAHYTELTRIYLTDVPSFALMYRPQSFLTVNWSVWTNFPRQGDGTNPPVPPLDLIDGYSTAGLYDRTLAKRVFLPLIQKQWTNSTVSLGTGALDDGGKATLSTASLSLGTHIITADYGGDTTFVNSTGRLLPDQRVVVGVYLPLVMK